jgi:hypothetical protein
MTGLVRTPRTLIAVASCLSLVALAVHAPQAAAAGLVPKGQRALLRLSAQSTGAVDHRTGVRDGGVKWKSKRAFEVTVEMIADGPTPILLPDVQGAFDGAASSASTSDVTALQKQLEKCPKNDLECRMPIISQIANAQSMQGQQSASPRYQTWRSAKGGSVTASATIDDAWQSVFYSAGREWSDCTLKGPAVSPSLAALGKSIDYEKDKVARLEANARGLVLVVDGESGTSSLRLLLASTLPADEVCKGAIANAKHDSREYRWVNVLPQAVLPKDFWIEGAKGSSPGNLVASGNLTLKGSARFAEAGPQFPYAIDAQVPFEAQLRWELVRQ